LTFFVIALWSGGHFGRTCCLLYLPWRCYKHLVSHN